MLVFHIFLLHLESSLKISLPTLRLHCSQAWAGALSTRALLLLEKVGLDHKMPGCVFLPAKHAGLRAVEPRSRTWPLNQPEPVCSWLESKTCHGLAPSSYSKMVKKTGLHPFPPVIFSQLWHPRGFSFASNILKLLSTCPPPIPYTKDSKFKPD